MGITPIGVTKRIKDIIDGVYDIDEERKQLKAAQAHAKYEAMPERDLERELKRIEREMLDAARNLEFEKAARLRDEIKRLTATELAIADDPFARQSQVEIAVDDAIRTISTETAPSAAKARNEIPRRRKMRRAGRPNVPKTFGSRRR